MICSVRGATTAENTRKSILANTRELLEKIIKQNNIETSGITSVIFTATQDLDAVYPAVAAREMGICDAGLMCMQEMFVEGSLTKCLRVLVIFETDLCQKEVRHVYLKGTRSLRPDLVYNNQTIKKGFEVAIDGPGGSGKSSLAKALAAELGFVYIDTGAMYRAVGYHATLNGVDLDDENEVTALLPEINIRLDFEEQAQRLFLNGNDVTDAIRSAEAGVGASKVAVYAAVRERLVDMQRELALEHDIIMDGRDIGTFVLPNADVKIYLDASPEVRAKRRCGELEALGKDVDYDTILAEIIWRDENDKTREISPLAKATDAHLLDTTDLNFDEVTQQAKKLIKTKYKKRKI